MPVQPAVLFRSAQTPVVYLERFTPRLANLEFLSCGEFEVAPGVRSQVICYPGEEALLFAWRAVAGVEIGGASYTLAPYDVLYVPKGEPFTLTAGLDTAKLVVTRAPAEHRHPVFHSQFKKITDDDTRVRRLPGKTVFLMFHASEAADRLVAGYTFFDPFSRSWPPHNHTDQEEVYFFLNGHGSMEVYENPETLTFVHNVDEGDAVTIPCLNYHPVFSQEVPLEFIWCAAGVRHSVGDQHKES